MVRGSIPRRTTKEKNMNYSEKELEKIFKRMMQNVNLSAKTRGSTRLSTQNKVNDNSKNYQRDLQVSKDGIVYRAKKVHDIGIDWEYLKQQWLDQSKKDYWFPNYELELNEIFVPHSIKAPSVDRLDDTKGYIKGNVVLTCRFANLGRGRYEKDEFISFTKKLFNN